MKRVFNLEKLRLEQGAHQSRRAGMCLLEAAAWMAGETHSDHPACVCPILGDFGRSLNDRLSDEKRQDLKPLLPLMLNTAGDGFQQRRGLMAAAWLITAYTPTWLELAGIDASQLRQSSIASWDDLEAVTPILQELAKKSAAASAAAWDAASAAASAAAWDAAWDAASAAAWDAACAAAWDAASAAASAAACAAASAAASAAACAALQPTVEQLQSSAIDVFSEMCRLGKEVA